MLLVALAGPILGALADATQRKKVFTGAFAALGILASAGLVWVRGDACVAGSVIFALGVIGFAGSNIFYESLLPHVARGADLDRVSTRGYALGYLGGGLLLVLNVLWLSHPSWFFMPDRDFALRACFASVAVWWAVFAWPLFRHVPEPESAGRERPSGSVFQDSFGRLARTFRQLRRYRQLALFLAAFWIYNDGISTVMKLAVAYGDEIGIGQADLLRALVITQFVGVPCALAFGAMGRRLGAKRAILLGLAAYTVICLFGFFIETAAHFYALAVLVGLVQGGTQALSRSLFAEMVPKRLSAEFFGFFSTGAKFAGILGPFLFGVIAQLGGSSRWGILSVVLFFLVGAVLLLRVDETEGRAVASAVDAEARAAPSGG
jgi:UMF1 family MFS transporter